jgi:outer membrane immunogenic protein
MGMKRILLITAAAMGVAFAQGALAADLGVRAAPVYVAPAVVAPTWTGIYLGFNGGWGWTNSNNSNLAFTSPAAAFLPFTVATANNNANSPVFGGQLGYNYQTGNWVWGIEGDVDGANIQANQNVFVPAIAGFPGGSAFLNEKQNWLASIRGRIGYTWGPGMIYVTGGGAWTGIQVTGGATLLNGTTGTLAANSTQSGYVVGAGYEWMIAPNWSLRGEYLYYGFTSSFNTGALVLPATAAVTGNLNKFNTSVVRIGLDYKFDWWPH